MGEPHQYHFDPSSYESSVRENVPDYETLQRVVAEAAGARKAAHILELGTGTGETLRRVAAAHPDATVVAVDQSEDMLAIARATAPPRTEFHVARLQDELPAGPFDVAVSVLAVHHLDEQEKQALFRAIAEHLAPHGRFVLGDLIEPDDPNDIVTPRVQMYDKPSRADDHVAWLQAAGFDVEVRWQHRDLFVVVADKR
jgi:tRNA (cmo5U34)-methyltransferase